MVGVGSSITLARFWSLKLKEVPQRFVYKLAGETLRLQVRILSPALAPEPPIGEGTVTQRQHESAKQNVLGLPLQDLQESPPDVCLQARGNPKCRFESCLPHHTRE
jgi:hypothetical protein